MEYERLIRNGLVVLPTEILRADIGIADGSIVAIAPQLTGSACETIDATDLHILPGVVDSHLHFNEPGRTEWEGAATGSAALAKGGGTCFCDMPLNSSPPTCDPVAFDLKRAALEQSSLVDFGLWGGLIPDNHQQLEGLADKGVIGFKAFMCDSGIEDFPSVDEDALGRGMEIAARLGMLVAVHAEDQQLVAALSQQARSAGKTSIRDYLDSRPIAAEVQAIERAIALAAQTNCSLHIVHVSSGAGVQAVVDARARGIDVTCETCPHYLLLTDQDVQRIGPPAKCSPPIRDAQEREALWSALKRGEIDFLASDHSPAPDSLKTSGNFFDVWGGIAGCQTTLGLILFEGLLREVPLTRLCDLLSNMPARRYGLARKGQIAVGMDADLVLIDLATNDVVAEEQLLYRHRVSPFSGSPLAGKVRRTLLRGRTIYADGKPVAAGGGKFVARVNHRLAAESP